MALDLVSSASVFLKINVRVIYFASAAKGTFVIAVN